MLITFSNTKMKQETKKSFKIGLILLAIGIALSYTIILNNITFLIIPTNIILVIGIFFLIKPFIISLFKKIIKWFNI